MSQPEKNILIMDDELDLISPIAAGLQRRGFRCSTVANIQDALTLLKTETFDLLLSDLRMPGGGTIELLRRLQTDKMIAPPTLIMTGLVEVSLSEAFSIGVQGLIKKPFDRNTLIQSIQAVLAPPIEKWKITTGPVASIVLTLAVQAETFEQAIANKEVRVGRGGFSAPVVSGSTSGDTEVSIPIRWGQGQSGHIHGILRWIETQSDGKKIGGIEIVGLPSGIQQIVLANHQSANVPFIPRTLAT